MHIWTFNFGWIELQDRLFLENSISLLVAHLHHWAFKVSSADCNGSTVGVGLLKTALLAERVGDKIDSSACIFLVVVVIDVMMTVLGGINRQDWVPTAPLRRIPPLNVDIDGTVSLLLIVMGTRRWDYVTVQDELPWVQSLVRFGHRRVFFWRLWPRRRSTHQLIMNFQLATLLSGGEEVKDVCWGVISFIFVIKAVAPKSLHKIVNFLRILPLDNEIWLLNQTWRVIIVHRVHS